MNLKVLLIFFLSISHARSMESYDICKLIEKEMDSKCYVDHNGFMIDLDYAIQINVNRPEKILHLVCHQKRELHNSVLEKFPQIDLSEIKKLNISGCVIVENSFVKKFIDRLQLTEIEEVGFDLRKKDKEIVCDIFDGLENVIKMTLKTHSSHTFHSDSFVKLESMNMMSLHVYDVTEPPIPATLFNVMRKLESLSIVSTAVVGSKNYQGKNFTLTFDDFVNLKNFSLEGIRRPVELILKLPKIVNNVKISNNVKMIKLGESELKRNDQIEDLNVSHNNLEEIHPKAFEQLSMLQRLDLSHNKISNLSEIIFVENYDLEYLDLSNNALKIIMSNIFASLENLKILRLDNNFLSEISLPHAFNGTTDLEILSLRSNRIRRIHQEMPRCMLKELDLRFNNISRFFLANFLSGNKSSYLNVQLANNTLESVDFSRVEEKMHSINFKITIDVGLSPIKCGCQTLSLYEFFHHKSFQNQEIYKRIEVIPKDIQCEGSSFVKDINTEEMICSLDDDHQNLCPKSCRCRNKAISKTLEIRCFNITKIPDLPPQNYLSKIVTSTILNVKGNGITSLPRKSCETYNQIIEIDASFNNINELNAENIPDKLKKLDLHQNNLKTISMDAIVKFSQLEQLQLSGNPWNCSISQDLVIFVKENRGIVRDLGQIRCADDGRYFLEIDYSFKCGAFVVLFVTIILLIFGFGAVFLVYRKYRKALTEWIFGNDKYHLFERVADVLLKKYDICFVMSPFDTVMVKYIADKLKRKPHAFKCAFVTRNWSSEEEIPKNALQTFRKSRRVAIILSEFFEEDNWTQWSYSNIYARLIIIEKGAMNSRKINLQNKMAAMRYNDPWFHEKLKYIIRHRHEMEVENDESDNNLEMQPLNNLNLV